MSRRETCKPLAATAGGHGGSGEVWPFRVPRLPPAWSAARDPALRPGAAGRRGRPDPGYRRAGSQVRSLGYRRVAALLQRDGWVVGKDRVHRIWRREGLKVPKRHRPRGRLWLNDGSCVRLRPERVNHVWSYDFVEGQTHDGRRFRVLTLIDEYTRECLAIMVARRIDCFAVIEILAAVMLARGIP